MKARGYQHNYLLLIVQTITRRHLSQPFWCFVMSNSCMFVQYTLYVFAITTASNFCPNYLVIFWSMKDFFYFSKSSSIIRCEIFDKRTYKKFFQHDHFWKRRKENYYCINIILVGLLTIISFDRPSIFSLEGMMAYHTYQLQLV